MTATSQHGFHPDAESLSAFSEHALESRERDAVLAHLAVCGRCRQVVALAREGAEGGEGIAAAPPRKTAAANAWWKQWRLVWIPTAVVTAFAAASVTVYIERADQHGTNIKIAAQNSQRGATPSSTPPPTEQAKVETPAAAAPATAPPPRPAKRAHTTRSAQLPAPLPPAVGAQMPRASGASEPGASEPRTMDQVEAFREGPWPSHAEAMQTPPEFAAGGMRAPASPPEPGAWEAEKKPAEQQRQAETDRPDMRSLKAKVAPFAGHGANAGPQGSATETVTVAAAPPPETPAAAPAEPTPATPTQLPSGLAAVSIASRGHLLLAIDKAGALFLSEDHGATWERIATQWTGRAVAVQQRGQLHGALYADPAAQNGPTGGSSGNAGLAPSSTAFFELSNDRNQTWVSTDGRTWTAK